MSVISPKDRARLRALAQKQLEFANCEKNEKILKQWCSLAEGKRETPTVRLLFSNFEDEVITPRMECEGEQARELEWQLLKTLVGRELFDDDTPIATTYNMERCAWVKPFGTTPKRIYAEDNKGYHIETLFEDLDEGLELLKGGHFGVDHVRTQQKMDFANEVFGDILPAKLVQHSLQGVITSHLVHLMNMENYYMSMYDTPETLHEVMDMATKVYEGYYDFLEKEGLLLPTADFSPLDQESFAFNNELPRDKVTSTKECWGFLESQETTAVSPAMYGEFVYPYQDRLVKRYGLLSYGCCERIDLIWEDYLSKWKNLRKLSVSPFNDERKVGEFLRGSNIVYYSKPRAEFVTERGPMDEDALRMYFKEVCECASGCLFEVAQREVGTIYGDFERGRRYVQIARECIEEFWKP